MVVSGFDITGLALKLYWLGACIGIGYLGFFFWKAAGIPLVVLVFHFYKPVMVFFQRLVMRRIG